MSRLLIFIYLKSSIANFGEKMSAKSAYLLETLVKTFFFLNRLFESFLKGISHHLSLY